MSYVKTRRISGVLAGLGLCALVACGDDGGATNGDDEGTTTNTTVDETTLPITVSATAADTTVSASNTGDTSSTTDPTDTTTSTTTDDGTGTGDDSTSTTGDDSTTGGLVPVEVEFCILQSPPTLSATTGQASELVYTRFYIETVTDQTVFNDPDERVVVEIGFGADGSTPPTDWTWTEAEPNPGWDGSMAVGGFGNENNDEHQAALTFPAAGTYDYAARVSGDDGATWVYCDLDGNVEGGYSTDMAGTATVTD